MKVLISGIGGRMGHELARLVTDGIRGSEPFAGYDVSPVDIDGISVYTDLSAIPGRADVIIDFSHHSATGALLEYAVANGIPAVIATTGHTPEEIEEIKRASVHIPLFRSANMSLGIALLVELARTAAKTFPDADIEIIEKHHNRKLDAPSGTALLIAEALRKVREAAFFTFGRHGNTKRQPDEIGIHAVRMGNIIGEHEVIIGTDTETITLKHEAHSRALFAEGALAAAEFLITCPAGMYDMNSMVTAK